MLLRLYPIVSSTVYMYSNGAMVMESMWTCSMEFKVDMPPFHIEFQVDSIWNNMGKVKTSRAGESLMVVVKENGCDT
jgi:hypothetical protein